MDNGKKIFYRDRKDAGKKLAEALSKKALSNPLLLALPRGGVPIAEEISKELGFDIDVLLVRKMTTKDSPEFARGAVAERGDACWDEDLLRRFPLSTSEKMEMEHRARLEIRDQEMLYKHVFPNIYGREVVVVDDGLATGWTARAASRSLGEAKKIWGAFPVAPEGARSALDKYFDEVICPHWVRHFGSVSLYYKDFGAVEDRVVASALSRMSAM